MKDIKITIPCHWNKEVIEEVKDYENSISSGAKIKETYGVLAKEIVRHGRAPETVPNISKIRALGFREFIKQKDMLFTYLLNAPFSFNSTRQKRMVEAYLYWIVEKFQADALMISSHELMKFARKRYPKMKIHISTIAGVKNSEELEKFMDISPSRVVPHHDTNRNFNELESLISKAHKWGVEIELMTTESCLRRCPDRTAHYRVLAGNGNDKAFHQTCNSRKLFYPLELLKANVIRPEDLNIYQKMGVDFFKITGRSKPASWLPEVAKAYLKQKYDGNLIGLLGIDPALNTEKWIYLDNKALNGFLNEFPKNKSESIENKYCNRWIEKLYNHRQFLLRDESQYKIKKNGILACSLPGNKLSKILEAESFDNLEI